MAISSPGVGSGLDVNSIVSQLMAIERQPLAALDKKEATYQAKLTAYGTLKSALSTFQSSAQSLSDISKFKVYTATPSDTTVLTASANTEASPATHTITIGQLAQSQKLTTGGFAAVTDTVGTGTLTIQFGTTVGAVFTVNSNKASQNVTIDSAHSSLSGVRDAINAANIGVTASIINDGSASPYKLVLTSNDSGAANSLKITVADTSDASNVDNAGLSQLAYDPAGSAGNGKNLTQTMTAQDATLTVDGITGISKSSNTVTDVIPGVTLNLIKAGSSNLTVARDTTTVKSSVTSFVNSYNTLSKSLASLTNYNTATKQAALLQGDYAATSILTKVRGTLTSSLTGASGSLTLLSQIGVSFQKDGTLALDSTKLDSAISSSFNDIAGLFAATGKASDSLISYVSATSNTKAGSYAVNVTSLATQGTAVGGAAITSYTIDGTNNALTLTVDGTSASVTLASGTYNSTTLAAELQTKINGVSALATAGISVKVSISGGNVVTITSNRYGSDSNASVTGGNGQNNLGFATATNTAGTNVAGTINSAATTGAGQYLTGGSGNNADGLKILVSAGSTGSRGTVSYSQGYAYQLDKLIGGLLATDGTIASRTGGIDKSIKDIGNQRDQLSRRLVDLEKRYRAQFTALDTMMSRMNATSSFLQQQMSNWSKSSNS